MEVILLDDIKGLGERGSRVQVARGFARNYLIPKRMAVAASKAGEAVFQEELRIRTRRDVKLRGNAETIKATLEGIEVHINAQASEEGRLYGSVTRSEIAASLAEMGREIDRKAIVLEEHIKQLGVYPIDIQLAPGVETQIKVWVERSEA